LLYPVQIIAIVVSITLMLGILSYTIKNSHVLGAREFGLVLVFPLLFSFASLMEVAVNEPRQILFWRNVAQVGNFLGPLAVLYFAMTFAGYNSSAKKIVPLLMIVQLISLIMIISPHFSSMMRAAVEFVEMQGRIQLVVTSTALGVMAVSVNYLLNLTAILVLLTVKATGTTVKQARLIALGLLVVSLLLFLKTFGILKYIDMSVLYLPGFAIILYGLFRYDLMAVSPIARNKAFEVIEEGIVVSSSRGRVVDMNPAGTALFEKLLAGLTAIERVDLAGRQTRQKDFNGQVESLIIYRFPHWWQVISACASGQTEFCTEVDGTLRTYLVSIYKLEEKKHRSIGSVSIIRDVSAERAEKELLEVQAVTDRLTGLYDQRYIKEAVANEVERSKRYNSSFSLIMFDLDNFKEINDRYGHLFGDEVLVSLATATKNTFRQSDLVARYGGDEFLVLLPETEGDLVRLLVERLLNGVQKLKFMPDGKEMRISISVGIASFPLPKGVTANPIAAADQALYDAKEQGKNRYCVFS
jgi:diguanylate cyclase